MRRDDFVDFFLIDAPHLAIHDRLCNWARCVSVPRGGARWQSPIWKLGKSNGRQWHEPEMREPLDTLDGHVLEKAVAALPPPHRDALRWSYVVKDSPNKARRRMGVTERELAQLVAHGRMMLVNRGV